MLSFKVFSGTAVPTGEDLAIAEEFETLHEEQEEAEEEEEKQKEKEFEPGSLLVEGLDEFDEGLEEHQDLDEKDTKPIVKKKSTEVLQLGGRHSRRRSATEFN